MTGLNKRKHKAELCNKTERKKYTDRNCWYSADLYADGI